MRSLIVLALALALCPALASASPGIRMVKPAEREARTDAKVQLTIVSWTVSKLEKPSVQVTTIEARVESVTGRKAAALPAGTLLRFEAKCSLEKAPVPDRMAGYPNGRCGGGWTMLPGEFLDATVKTVTVPLVVRDDGRVWVVPTSSPEIGSLAGKIVPAKPSR